MGKVRICGLLFICILLAALCGCGEENTDSDDGGFKLYYLNENKTELKTVEYDLKTENTEANIDEVLKAMRESRKKCFSAIPENLTILSYKLSNDTLYIDFGKEYLNLDSISEIFVRAAVVLTVTQLEDVSYVVFTADDKPIRDAAGDTVGTMSASSFTDGVGNTFESYKGVTVTLYFANVDGNMLRTEFRKGLYDSDKPLERYIVEQLIAGPSEDGNYKTICPDTQILSINTNNGVCYVDFSSEFLKDTSSVKDEIMLYSIVNSLTELSHISKVQISVEGDTDIELHGGLSLNTMHTRSLEYMEQ